MRPLTAATNIDPASGDYPNGRVRDLNGGAGTLLNEVLMGDIIQFFQKLVIDAGISENNLPDNITNGYQLLTSLDDRYIKSFNTLSLINGWDDANNRVRYRLSGDGLVQLHIDLDTPLSGGQSSDVMGILPASYRPAHAFIFPIVNENGNTFDTITIATNGEISMDRTTAYSHHDFYIFPTD